MKTRYLKFLAILLPLALACTVFTRSSTSTAISTQIQTGERAHFENELVAFDYLAGARIYAAGDPAFQKYPVYYILGGELVVGLANPGWFDENGTLFSSIGIFRHALPAGSNLEEVMAAVYVKGLGPLPEEVAEQSGPYKLDEWIGVQKTYKSASGALWYTSQDIWFEMDGSILRISLNNEAYEADFQAVADLFLSSLVIKDTLPPFTEQPTPAPTSSPTPFPAALLIHYEASLLSFDYPRGLSLLPAGESPSDCFPNIPFGGQRLVGLGDPRFLSSGIYYRCIQITRLLMPSGSNLEAVMLAVYDQAKVKYPQDPSSLATTGAVTVSGQTGFQWAYRITAGEPTYELRDGWLEKDGQVYIISIWTEYTNPDDFWVFQSGAQAFLDSLIVK
jgi:hypothetical protein